MKHLFLSASLIACMYALALKAQGKMTVFTIGDSTMADKPDGSTEHGWGMLFPLFTDTAGVQVSNNGFNGRSTKSFIEEGKWTHVLDQLKAGDFVLIQFGHNDEKTDASLHTNPATSYRGNLEKFVTETRTKGATPVLLTSIVRRNFDAYGNIADTHGAYPDAVRATATELHVPLIDMELKTSQLETVAGLVGSRKIHKWNPPTEIDNTHLCYFGAYVVARLVAEGIRELGLAIPLGENPQMPDGAAGSTLEWAYTLLADHLLAANHTLSTLPKQEKSGFSNAVATAQSNLENKVFTTLSDIDSVIRTLRSCELALRWSHPAPFDATFALGNPSLEEGTFWDTRVNANIPMCWTLDAMPTEGTDVQLKNSAAHNGYYRYYIGGSTDGCIDFYQDLVLPAGEYTVTAALKPHTPDASFLYVKVNGKTNKKDATGGSWDSWAVPSVVFTVPTESTVVRIGVSSSSAVMIDDFRLQKTENPNLKIQAGKMNL